MRDEDGEMIYGVNFSKKRLVNGEQRNEIVAGRGLQSREGSCLGFKTRRQ